MQHPRNIPNHPRRLWGVLQVDSSNNRTAFSLMHKNLCREGQYTVPGGVPELRVHVQVMPRLEKNAEPDIWADMRDLDHHVYGQPAHLCTIVCVKACNSWPMSSSSNHTAQVLQEGQNNDEGCHLQVRHAPETPCTTIC